MALYQKEMNTSLDEIKTAKFNPIVTGRENNDADSKLWQGQKVFEDIDNLKPEMTPFIGEFTINTEDIEVDNKVLINGSVNSEFKGSNVRIEIEKIKNPNGTIRFDFNDADKWKEITPGRYKVEIEWPKPYIDQKHNYKKNQDGSFEKLTSDDLTNYTGELYTKDAIYAGKTGSVDLEVKVIQVGEGITR